MYLQSLCGPWQMKCTNDSQWQPATVPGSVIADLLNNQKIEDPFWRMNEYPVRDLFENDYEYIRVFSADIELLEQTVIELVCDGLDTLATVYLNERIVGKADNMHRTWRFDLKGFLRLGENTIRIVFDSPIRFVREAKSACEDEIGYTAHGSTPGNGFLRKAHCMFGWDWGPQLPDAGIWRKLQIEAYSDAKLEDVLVAQIHQDGAVTLNIKTGVHIANDNANYQVKAVLTSPVSDQLIGCAEVKAGSAAISLLIENPLLWWPNGYGEHPLYQLEITLLSEVALCGQQKLELGLRTLTVSTAPDEWGNEFCFVINGVKIFAMGADYVPEDSLLSRVTPTTTEKLIASCTRANFNSLRVWGGGYYPDDFFFELCDRYGLIVWQDLMFACNVYVFTPDFEQSIAAEVRDNVRRIRHHASLGLWCGNNEMELGWVDWDRVKHHSLKLRADYIKQFEYLLPKVTAENDPYTFYWKASPSSTGHFNNPNDENMGDVHYWEVWHELKPFTDFRKLHFRFCSEFGFQAFPPQKTVETYTLPEDRNIFSRVMESHQKHSSANGRILFYISDYCKYPKDFDSLLYVSQVLQAEAIRYGVEHWRRNRGRCMGAIYWQLNDCWPVASWASVDYYGRWKALHYAARKFFAHETVTVLDEDKQLTYYMHNDGLKEYQGVLHVCIRNSKYDIILEKTISANCPALSAVPVYTLDAIELCKEYGDDQIYASYTFTINGEQKSYGSNLFVKPKHFQWQSAQYTLTLQEMDERWSVHICSNVYAQQVELTLRDCDAVFSDNYFDICTPEGVTVSLEKSELPADIMIDTLKQQLQICSMVDSF